MPTSPTSPAEPTATVDAPPLRILGLRVSNYKRVVAIDLRPDGRSVLVGGDNAQGKTSLLDSIADALGGAKRGSKTDLALRTGSVKGEVRVDLGDYVVIRTWTPSSDKLVVESPPGSPLKSPQAVLDKLVGDLSFDPLAFARQDAKTQAETLRRISGLDTREIDTRRATAYTERTRINGDVKTQRAVRDAVAVPPEPPAPPARPSVSGLLDEQTRLRQRVIDLRGIEAAPGEIERAIATVDREIAAATAALAAFGPRIAGADAAAISIAQALDKLRAAKLAAPEGVAAAVAVQIGGVESLAANVSRFLAENVRDRDAADKTKTDGERLRLDQAAELDSARGEAQTAFNERQAADARLSEIDAALRDADAATARHEAAVRAVEAHRRAMAEWSRLDAEVKRLEAEAARRTETIERCDADKLAAIGAARMPVTGLGIDGDVVTFRGVPFSQASGAEKVRVGMAVGAALNPTLRVILVREGALLDDTSLSTMLANAAERGFQVWVETVGERDAGESVGVVIEDGRVHHTHGAPTAGAVEEG